MSEFHSILPTIAATSAAAAEAAAVGAPVPQEMYTEGLHRLPIQRKIAIGAVNDPLEQEADAMADRVMRMPEAPFVQRKCAHCEEKENAQGKPLPSFIQKKDSKGDHLAGNHFVQRKQYKGEDDAGFYEIDDQACTFNYHEDWYFKFGNTIPPALQAPYMASGKSQVENNWSGKYKLVSGTPGCPCANGFTTTVQLNTINQPRKGRHGYTIDVKKGMKTSTTNPATGNIDMEDTADVPLHFSTTTQDIMAHEFGHTIGLEDEYNWWAGLFGVPGSHDPSSVMHDGSDVKPWHYQHFADILNLELGRCTFYPEGGVKGSSLAEPRAQLGLTTGAWFNKASLDPSKAAFVIGLHVDNRVSNNAVLGLFYPTLGFDTYWDFKNNNLTIGPTAGLRLNRILHPLFVDLSTGALFSPGNGVQNAQLNIPFSMTLGLRGKGFNAGVNYTPMVDVLNGGKYSHIIGLNFQADM